MKNSSLSDKEIFEIRWLAGLPRSKRDLQYSILQTVMDQAYKNLRDDDSPFDFEVFDRELTRLPK
jgi:hypothetical protein